MKKNGLWVIAFVIAAIMILTTVSPISMNRNEIIDDTTYHIGDMPLDNPDVGDLWYDTTFGEMNIWNGYVWQPLVPTISGASYQDHVAKHYWGGIDPIKFHKLSPNIRVASEFATSGSGTWDDPYIGGLQEAYDDLPDSGGIILANRHFQISNTVTVQKDSVYFVGLGATWTMESPYNPNIRLANNSNCDMFAFGNQSTPINFGGLFGLTLDGNKANQASGSCVYVCNSQDLQIRDCFLSFAKQYGVYLHPFAAGDSQNRVSNLVIANNWIELNDGHSIHMVTSTKVNCQDISICENLITTHIHLENNAITSLVRGIKIFGNRIYSGNIEMDGLAGFSIQNNNLQGGNIKITEGLAIERHGIIVSGNTFDTSSGNAVIYIGGKIYGCLIANNNLKLSTYTGGVGGTPLILTSPAWTGRNLSVINNFGINPIGVISSPFDNTNHIIKPNGVASTPIASRNYIIDVAPCRIISTDSGDTNCSITIKDKAGNTIESGLSIYDNWLEIGWTINWGAFTGTAPTVTVVFR